MPFGVANAPATFQRMHEKFGVEFYKGGVLVVKSQYIKVRHYLVTRDSIGVYSRHLNIEFELKRVVALLG